METLGYRAAVIEYIRAQARPREKFSHQPRLYRLACVLGAGIRFDDDILFAAAWMHDLGVFVGHRPEDPRELASWDHLAYALRVVPGILTQAGFPAEKIPGVLEAIRTHLPSGEPTTQEAVLLRDADILEQLGAVGILRTVCKVGRDTRFVVFPDALQSLRRAVDQLPAQLKTPAARRLAEPRVASLQTFLDSAESEGALTEE
ncbi:MAG: phosphohydrolase [Verrucomicrobiota bacterium]